MTTIKFIKAVLKYEDEDVYVELDARVSPANKDCDVSVVYTYDEWKTPRSKNGSFQKSTSVDESLYRIPIYVSNIPRNSRIWFALKLVDHKTGRGDEHCCWDNNDGMNYEIIPEKLPQICLPTLMPKDCEPPKPSRPASPPSVRPLPPQLPSPTHPSPSPVKPQHATPTKPQHTTPIKPQHATPVIPQRATPAPYIPQPSPLQSYYQQNQNFPPVTQYQYQYTLPLLYKPLPSQPLPQNPQPLPQNSQPLPQIQQQYFRSPNNQIKSQPKPQPLQTQSQLTPQQLFKLQHKIARSQSQQATTKPLPTQKPTPSQVFIPSDIFSSHSICSMMQGHHRLYDEYIC